MSAARVLLLVASIVGADAGLARADHGQCDFIKFSRNKIYASVGNRQSRLSADKRRQLALMAREERAIGCR